MTKWGVAVFLFLAFAAFSFPVIAQEEQGRVYSDFGVFAYEDGDYQDAEANFRKALSFDPQNPYTNHYLGKTYLKLGQYDKAEQYLTTAWGIGSWISGLKYDMALLYFKQGAYEKSAPLFADAAVEDPTNVLSLYYAGIGFLNTQRYDRALYYLTEASNQSPTIKPNGYYYAGVCHLQMGQYDQATAKFEYVIENAKSPDLRKNAEKWLTTSRNRQKSERRFRFFLKFGYQYDSNVLLEPIDEEQPTDEDDFAWVGYGSFKFDAARTENFTAGIGYNHYQIFYEELDQYDLFGSIPNFYARYRWNDLTFGFTYLLSYYELDWDGYLTSHQFRPDLLWRISDDLTAKFVWQYDMKKYLTNDDRSGHGNTLDADLFYSILDGNVRLFAGGGIESYTAESEDQAYNRYKGRVGAQFFLP